MNHNKLSVLLSILFLAGYCNIGSATAPNPNIDMYMHGRRLLASQNQVPAVIHRVENMQSQAPAVGRFSRFVNQVQEVFVGKKGKPVQVVAIAAVAGLAYYAVKKSGILLTKQEKFKKLANELYILQKKLNKAEASLRLRPANLELSKVLAARMTALNAKKAVLKKAIEKLQPKIKKEKKA